MKLQTIAAGLLLLLATASCKKDKKEEPKPEVKHTWQFTAGGKTFTGTIKEAVFIDWAGGQLNLVGTPLSGTTDTLFSLTVQFGNGKIEPGVYKTDQAGTNFLLGKLPEGDVIYAANVTSAPLPDAPGHVISINIASYDPQTRVVTGTFSGDSYNSAGENAPVTKGSFSIAVKQ